jgi:hypothetical protein
VLIFLRNHWIGAVERPCTVAAFAQGDDKPADMGLAEYEVMRRAVRMTANGPARTKGPAQAIGGPLGPADLPAEDDPAPLLSSSETVVPSRSVGREAFRSAAEGSAFGFASRERASGRRIEISKPQQLISKKRLTKSPRDPSTSEARARGSKRCYVCSP